MADTFLYNQPAVDSADAVMTPAMEPGAGEGMAPALAREEGPMQEAHQGAQGEGMTPALPREEGDTDPMLERLAQTPAREQPPGALSHMRTKLRLSADRADRMRGGQTLWQDAQGLIHTEPAAPGPGPASQRAPMPGHRQTSPRLPTRVRAREEAPAAAPMQGALQGTIKRMIAPQQERRPMTAHRALHAPLAQQAQLPAPVGAGVAPPAEE